MVIRTKTRMGIEAAVQSLEGFSGRILIILTATAICGLSVCSTVEANTATRVDALPVDRFDDYLAGTVPLHPWELVGNPGAGVTVKLAPAGESPFCGNKETGKGLVCQDSSDKAGHGVGLGRSFTPPPEGDIYLGFDFKYAKGHGAGVGLICRLKGENGGELDLSLGLGDSLAVKDDTGKDNDLYSLRPDGWYHLGVTLHPDGVADFVLFDCQKNGADRHKEIKLPSVKVALPERIDRLEFFSSAPDVATGGWVLDNVCMAGQVHADRAEIWPFARAPLSELRRSPRKVFAYYFIYGSGHSDRDPGLNWYTRTVRNPTANNKKDRADAGTELLYRPYPRPRMPQGLTKEQVRARALEEEVRLAIQQGLDGFLVDFWQKPRPNSGAVTFSANSFALLGAAAKLDPGFKILPAVYSASKLSGINGESDADVDPLAYANSEVVAKILAHPATCRLPDGRVAFSMWLSEKHSPDWWRKVIAQCEKNGHPIALIPQFNSRGKLAEFAPISYAMANWGPRTPHKYNWIETVRNLGVKCVHPIVAQDVRTRGCSLWEAGNSALLRGLWQQTIEGGADWAFVYTWNDYSEQAMAPSTQIGFVPYDLNAYYSQWFKTGTQPKIIRDTLYYFHRRHHCDVTQLKGKKWRFRIEGDPKGATAQKGGTNNIEVVAFLTAPGRIAIDVNGKVTTKDVPGGISVLSAPLPKGKSFVPTFSLFRDGKSVISGRSLYPIVDRVEYPNMLYCSGILAE